MIKRIAVFAALAATSLLVACSGDSGLPEATGKATISAVNAMSGSPAVNFLIEERQLSSIAYKSMSVADSWDDLEFTFNFDVLFTGDSQFTRIASRNIDFIAGQHYTLLATGTVANPTLTLWETAEREFDTAETVFQSRFAHTSDTWSATNIDVYFALEGVAPVQGEQVATLAFGEITTAPVDFETGTYVVTITTAGDVTDILYQSLPSTLVARTDLIVSPFDGDENDTSPIVVRVLNTLGGAATLANPLFPPTVQFLNAAQDMGNTDVYDDVALTTPVLTGHDFRQLTPPSPIAAGDYNYLYTPANETTAVLLDTNFNVLAGINHRIVAIGAGGEYSTLNIAQDKRSFDTSARFNFFVSSNNFEFVDLYVVNRGDSIDGNFPFISGVVSRIINPAIDFAPGNFDLYLTNFAETDIVAGPISIDMALGDVIDLLAFDTADPAVLEMLVFPTP